jgi:glyoxylase-like metal-dependent hydrolase (beta-lactamase superfamily II)
MSEENTALYAINTGHFKLDGGAMFGVVPKSIWHKINPSDENNMCSWAMRSLLLKTKDRLILIDNGMGDKQSEKFFGYYYLHGEDTLEKSLQVHGFKTDDITDNVITHLHFDHCGGGVKWNKSRTDYELTFKNATYHISKAQWESAMNPNAREKASFLKENILPMKEAKGFNLVEKAGTLFPGFEVRFVNGHTDGQMIPIIEYKGKTIVFMADLLPSPGHIPLPYVMAYDIRPLDTMKEKKEWLQEAADKNWILFFEHDPEIECCTLKHTEKGVRPDQFFKLSDII